MRSILLASVNMLLLASCGTTLNPQSDQSDTVASEPLIASRDLPVSRPYPSPSNQPIIAQSPPPNSEAVPATRQSPPLKISGGREPDPPDPASTVYFEQRSAELSADARALIRTLSEQLAADGRRRVLLVGHSEELGSKGYCVALAAQRMGAVSRAMLQFGVRINQVQRRNRGCETAADRSCVSDVCREQSRRVDIRLGAK
jgi:OmpA-OmpF porin, OOP family